MVREACDRPLSGFAVDAARETGRLTIRLTRGCLKPPNTIILSLTDVHRFFHLPFLLQPIGTMKTRTPLLVALALLTSAASSHAATPAVDYVSKAFRDGDFVPRVYDESKLIQRYGAGEKTVAMGQIQRRYTDPTTGLEVTVIANADGGPEHRTVDVIRVSSITTGAVPSGKTESLRGVTLKGVAIGDPAAKALAEARKGGEVETEQVKLGAVAAERVCKYAEDLLNLCYYTKGGKVVAMEVGVSD